MGMGLYKQYYFVCTMYRINNMSDNKNKSGDGSTNGSGDGTGNETGVGSGDGSTNGSTNGSRAIIGDGTTAASNNVGQVHTVRLLQIGNEYWLLNTDSKGATNEDLKQSKEKQPIYTGPDDDQSVTSELTDDDTGTTDGKGTIPGGSSKSRKPYPKNVTFSKKNPKKKHSKKKHSKKTIRRLNENLHKIIS